MQTGAFFVIEGSDGSGKGTQFKLLQERLKAEGYTVSVFDFPQYDKPSAYFVKEYLNGAYGSSEQVGPYRGSLFFALDRYEAAPRIREALAHGHVVLANRYTGSNMAHQGTKFANREERLGFYIWLDNLEFQMLEIPRPTKNIVLRVPAEIAQTLVDKKETRSYTDKKRDIHEADLNHLRLAVNVYDELTSLFPKDFSGIDCMSGGQLLSIASVHEVLWAQLQPMLPPKQPGTTGRIKEEKVPSNDYIKKNANGSYDITESGKAFLREAVTSTDGDVYAFSEKLSPVTIAAAMARLSRRGDDMRVTLLDEFAGKLGKDAKLLQRVITAYGDDSVQQLTGIHVVVENASNLLTKKLEWGRLAAYLEQSTRYIYFDQKDTAGNYRYHTPKHFTPEITQVYRETLNKIFDLYSRVVHNLTEYITANDKTPTSERDVAWKGAVRAQACDAARPLLPVATTSTVGIYASGQALESLIMHLQSDALPEAQTVGQSLLEEARKVLPAFLERADKPDRGGAMIAYRASTFKKVRTLADKYLPQTLAPEADAVTLLDYSPRNELDIVADILYEHSQLSKKQLREEVGSWPYMRKAEVLEAFVGERLNRRHKPGRALEQIHYSWDLICDYGIFRDLQRHRMVEDLTWQELSPRYGYDIPKLVEDAGMVELFEQCFDLSLALYSQLQAAGFTLEAQYATLLGHKMRWKVTYNAREAFHLHELRTSPQGHPGYRKLVQHMHEKVAEVHPMLAEAMKFVNQGEDAELTRLAAERYTQWKLEQLR